ncbi:5,6-dimethylbenzimidazole synthase [Sulfurimonas marina]|uniref:5,6-dimethylbenzimidazole synthase n=1 Tax=Sulfurimonas marina TaxID=2590551 RepID=A0A7M3V955_9BACT|nr:5,6-dimethylbenzimidazole synthase [Sulfurimonas marina]QOP40288.1 5,6-dimethylbenzimidazole synthase [Sulfurimonas marina]
MRFCENDTQKLLEIMKARRDVRGNRFIDKKVEDEKLSLILEAALLAPSVGYSQPWKFIVIEDEQTKDTILENFDGENEKAKTLFASRELYQKLKLEGIKEAPINIAVLYEPNGEDVLGMTSMEQMGEYSVVCAVQNMWLLARSLNIGIGWVSILDENKVLQTLEAPKHAKLIAYLCVGYVDKFYEESELKTLGWEQEKQLTQCVTYRR